MSSPLVAPPLAKPKALFCPNCGGPVELRGFGHALTVVCPQCLTLLDSSTPLLKVLQQVDGKMSRKPLIPLGTRGNMHNATWEFIGFQVRYVESEGVRYEWHEYLLFNPYVGFRYLTFYNGHWNWVTPLESMPGKRAFGKTWSANYENFRYRHFSGSDAVTSFILGEFPWRVKAGDRVRADDFISPPYILSQESTSDETTWSQGIYTSGADIWKAFALPGGPPVPSGVYLNQPSPYKGTVGGIWKYFLMMIGVIFVLMIVIGIASKEEQVLSESHQFSSADQGEASYVTKEFQLTGRPANVELAIDTNLNNNWAYFNFALVNEDTAEAYDFGREVSYYYGTDSDGSWTEGDRKATVLLPPVPPGKYYLRVEPELDDPASRRSISYSLTVKHDVASFMWFLIAGGLLLIPPILRSIKAAAFESRRWSESDHAPKRSASDDD